MNLIYTKTRAKIRRNVFVVNFQYEHGDADSRTQDTKVVPLSKDEFVHYLAKVKEVAGAIRDGNAAGVGQPSGFEDAAEYGGVSIPLERDCYFSMHSSGMYATMRIDSILYFDDEGQEFQVTEQRRSKP